MDAQLNGVEKPVLDLAWIKQFVDHDQETVFGKYQSHELRSAFQPIFSFSHKRIVGYEALARIKDQNGLNIAPNLIFSSERRENDVVFLDRLCRCVHLRNFSRGPDSINWLFLNVSSAIINSGPSYGPFFAELLKDCDFPAHRVVIEIVEHPISDQAPLSETVEYFKNIGCLIAIDDFGAGYSNFERIWSLNPHIVKLDRSMIVQATQQKKIRQLFPGIVSLLHQAGALVLVEGIEDMEQAMIAMESDVDFVQGFYFARPTPNANYNPIHFLEFDMLFDHYKEQASSEQDFFDHGFDQVKALVAAIVAELKRQIPLEQACLPLLAHASVVRCYLLRTDGVQIEKTVISSKNRENADLRYRPLEDAKSADWFRRHYLRRAVLHPDQIQITRPYLSITGGHMCTTLSLMFSSQQGPRVFCCDLSI